MTTDLRPTIVPKSDQLNADDLIGRTITIKITKVSLSGDADQPVCIHFEGDNGKPYKPGKSMRRVLVAVWGDDGNAFVGRRMTLYRDERVQFGGFAVGGIRISHMSDISQDITMPLTTTRATRKPFTVHVLRAEQPLRQGQFDPMAWAAKFLASLPGYDDVDPMRDDWNAHKGELKSMNPARFREVNQAVANRAAAISLGDGGDDAGGSQEGQEGPGGATSPPAEASPAPGGPESSHSGDVGDMGAGLFGGGTVDPPAPPTDPLAWAAEVNADLEGMSLAEIDALLADGQTQAMVDALIAQGMPGTADALSRAIETRRRALGWAPA